MSMTVKKSGSGMSSSGQFEELMSSGVLDEVFARIDAATTTTAEPFGAALVAAETALRGAGLAHRGLRQRHAVEPTRTTKAAVGQSASATSGMVIRRAPLMAPAHRDHASGTGIGHSRGMARSSCARTAAWSGFAHSAADPYAAANAILRQMSVPESIVREHNSSRRIDDQAASQLCSLIQRASGRGSTPNCARVAVISTAPVPRRIINLT